MLKRSTGRFFFVSRSTRSLFRVLGTRGLFFFFLSFFSLGVFIFTREIPSARFPCRNREHRIIVNSDEVGELN